MMIMTEPTLDALLNFALDATWQAGRVTLAHFQTGLVAERKGAMDDRMEDFRWLLEELRVSLFAQELRTPQPVSVKRLEKAWGQLVD